jgi:hypothetical protein
MQEFVLAIIFSHWTLSKIINFLADYLNVEISEIGPCKIERYRDRRTGIFKDSNRTLIMLKKHIYDKAIQLGLNHTQAQYDFRIESYRYNYNKEHPPKDYSSNLYLIIPKQISCSEVEIALRNKLNEFSRYGFLKSSECLLQIPLSSRITGETKGLAMLRFDQNVNLATRVNVKLLLHDCFIYLKKQEKLYHLPAFWLKS